MVSNCFISLQRGDFPLIVDSLPSLAERLKESEPRCVERVCTCFARLVAAYRAEPEVLQRIVSSCNLFSNLQHLVSTAGIIALLPDHVRYTMNRCTIDDVIKGLYC